MGDSKPYILVSTSVPVKLQNSCSVNDVKSNFSVKVNDVEIDPVNIFVNHPGFPQHSGKILLELKNSDIPLPNDKLEVSYTNTTTLCNIIHRDLSESLSTPLSDFSHNTDKSEIISSTTQEDFPTVVDIDCPNEDGGKSIFISIKEFRNISSSDNFDNFNITVNPTVNSVYNDVIFSNIPTLVNKRLKFVATTGAMEKGSTYDVSYVGNNIKDQHGFLLNTFSTAPVECKNSVQNLVFHSGSIDTTSPNKILLRFKNPITNKLVSVSNNLFTPYNNELNTYKMYVKNDLSGYNITLNADFVKTIVPVNETTRVIEYTAPIIFKHNDNVSVEWDSKVENNSNCIKDLYNNIVLNSQYDPLAGVNTENSKSIKIENNIKGITINSNTSIVTQNTSAYSILLNFTRLNNEDELVPITLIDLDLNKFKIKNNSTSKEFFPDSIVNQSGNIILSVNYNTTNFDKVINIYDNITVDYLDDNWPSTIKDSYNNYMLKQTNIPINNNVEYGGSVVLIEQLIDQPLKIKLTYSTDICGNTLLISNFIIRDMNTTKPNIIGIEQDSHDNKVVFLNLDRETSEKIYLSSLPNTIKNINGIYVSSLNDALVTKFLHILNIDVPDEEGGKAIYIKFPDNKIISGSNLDGFSVTVFKSFKSNYETVTFNTTAVIDNEKKNQLKLQVLDGLMEEGDTFNISYNNPVNTYIKDQFDLVLHNFVFLWGNSILSNSIKTLMVNNTYIKTETSNKIIILFQKNINGPVVNVGNDISWSYDNSSNKYKAYKISSENTLIEINVLFVNSLIVDGIMGIEFTLDQSIKYNEDVAISWDSKIITTSNRIIDEYGNEVFSSIYDLKNKIYSDLEYDLTYYVNSAETNKQKSEKLAKDPDALKMLAKILTVKVLKSFNQHPNPESIQEEYLEMFKKEIRDEFSSLIGITFNDNGTNNDVYNVIDVTNNIDGITIKENPDLIVIENTETLELEIDVYFKRITSGETINGFLNLTGGTTVNDFIIKNHTTNKSFNPDNISNNENGSIHLTIDLTKLNFDKTINVGDVITLQVLGHNKIKDEFNNYMIETKEFSIKNNVNVNGLLNNIKIKNEEFDKIILEFSVDISENTINTGDFVFSPTKTIKSAALFETNKIILTLENDIIENSNYTVTLKEDFQLRNIYGTKIERFENEPIIIDDLSIRRINVEISKKGKSISIYFPPTRNISNSLNLNGFNASIISNPNGNYLKENFVFGSAVMGSGNNIIEIPVLTGAFQRNTVYDISYNGSGIKDQYNKVLNHFSSSPVACENSLYTVIYKSGSVATETPKKILMDFSKKTTYVTMGINIREIDYNNELGNYKLYIDSVETAILSVKTINISEKIYLEYTISNPINYKNVVHVGWDLNNLSFDNKIRSLDDIEAYSSEETHVVINNIDGIKISNSSNVSQKANYFEIKLDFSRINSNIAISPFNALGGDIFDNSYLNDFSIKKNGMLISANSIIKNDDSILLSINYSESDFSNVIDISDNIQIEYVGNKTIIDQYTNTLLREPPIDIINNVTNVGNIVSAINPSLEKDKIILLFDSDICGNTVNIEDFELNIPNTSGITILNIIREYERTLKIFLSGELTDTSESTVTIKENYSLRTNYGIKVNRFADVTIEYVMGLGYGLRLGDNTNIYAGQDLEIKGTEYLLVNPQVDTSFQFKVYYRWFKNGTSFEYYTNQYFYDEVTQAYPPVYPLYQQFNTDLWYKLKAFLILKKLDGTYETIEVAEVNVLENQIPILKTPVISNYYVNVDQTIGISVSDIIIDPDGGDIQYEALSTDTLPSWISFSNETFTIQNPTIEEIGDYTISIKGYDDKMAPLFFDFTVTVQDTIEPLNISVQNNSGSILGSSHTMNEDTGFTFSNIITTGGNRSSILIKVTDDKTLPSWLTLSSTNEDGTATLTGTPPDGDLTYTIDLTATDGTNSSNVSFDIHVISVNSPTTGSVAIVYPTILIPGKTINAVPSFIDDEGIKSITYSWKRVYQDGTLDNASVGTVLNNGIDGASYTLTVDDIGYKIQVWCIITDNEDITHPEDSSNSFKSNISNIIEPRFRILDIGTIISDPPIIGKSSLTYGYEDPSDYLNIRNIRFQWQKKFPLEVSWTNIDQTDTTDSLLSSNFEDCSGQIIRLKITYNTTGGFTNIIGYTPVTQIVQDNRPKITGIRLMEGDTQIEGTNYYTKNQLNNISLKVTFDTNVQVVTLVEDQIPDINIQIGGQGSEPTSTSNETDKDNFSTQHKTSLLLETRLIGPDADGKWKTTPHTELTFRMPIADDLGISNPVGLVELWGSSYHIETDPALRRDDRLMSLGLEGSHIKSYSAISNKNDLHAIVKLPNLFSEIIPSVSINVFTEPSITLTADPNNGVEDGKIIPLETSIVQINKVGLPESYINYYEWQPGRRFNVTVENTDSGNVYKIDNVRQPTLQLRKKQLYTFSQQYSSNSGHPMNFFRNSDKTGSLGDHVIVVGIPSGNSAGDLQASTLITLIIKDTIDVSTIYYQCQNHANMGGEITILDETPDTYQIIQKDINEMVGLRINYTLPWESESATIYKSTAQVVDIDNPPRFITSFENVRITEGAIYEKDFEFTDDEYFTGTNNYLKVTGKYLLDGLEITIPTYKRYNIDKNASDEMIITDENGDEVGDIILTVGVKYSFIVDKTFYDSYGFEIYKQLSGTNTARDTIIGYSTGALPGPHESDLTKYNINLYFSEFPETGEDTLYFGSAFTSILNLGRKEFSLQYSPIILRAGGSGLNALEYKLIAFFNKDEMDNITVDGTNNVLPVTLTVSDTPVDEGSTPQTKEATFNITVDNIDILNNTVSGTSIRANGIYENGKSTGGGPLEYEMNEIFDGDYTKEAKIKIVSEADLSGKNRTIGDNYGMINIDLGRSYPIYGIRFYHRGALSVNPQTTIPKQIQVWYSVGTLDNTYYQNDSTITVAHYTNNFQLGRANTVFNLSNEPGYKYFYFNQGIDVTGISKSENICFNSQVYTRYLHLKIIDVWEPTKQYTEIPSIDFIGPGTKGQSNYLFNSDVITFNNTVNHLQLQKQKEVILSRFIDPIEADINDYNIEIKDQAGANIITDSVISVDPTSKTIRYANENTDSSDYYKQVIIKLTPKSGGDEIVQVFAINIGSEDIVAVTRDVIPTQIKMISDDYSIDSYSFFDNPEAKSLIYSGNYKNITESNYQPITFGGNSGIYLNGTGGMTFGISSDHLGTGIYNIILDAQLDNSLIRSPTLPSNFTENTTSTKRSQQFDLIVMPNTTLTLNYDESTRKIEASINNINNINDILDKIYKLKYTWKEKSGDDWIDIAELYTTIKGTTGEIMKFEYDDTTKQVSVNEGTPSTTITDVAFDANNSVPLSSIANKTVKLFMEVTVYDRNINCNILNDPGGQSHYLTLSYDGTSITKEFTSYGDSWSSRGDQRLFNRPEDRHPNLILSDSGRKFGESNVELYVLKSELYNSGMAVMNCITKSEYDSKSETEKQDYEQADKNKYYAYPSIFMPYNSSWQKIPQKLSIESNSIMILDLQSNLQVPDTHVGYTLSIDTSNFPIDYTYSYKWERADTLNGTYATVVLSTTSYTLTDDDVEKFIRLTVEYNVDGENITLSTSGIEVLGSHGTGDDMVGEDDMGGETSTSSVSITPSTDITINIQLDEYTVGFVRNSLQEALFNLYGDPVKSTALGSINGSVGDDITLSGFTTSILNGKKILAIERWYNGGWTPSSMGTNLIVGFTGTGLTTENAPVLKYNNVFYPALEVATPENWGGVTIDGGFQIVRYSNLGLAIHTEAFPGAADIAPIPVSSITFTKILSFHDPNIITQLSGGSIYITNPSPQTLSNINIIGSGLTQNWFNRSKVHNSGTLIIEGELRLYNGALFTNTGYIIIKSSGRLRLYNGDEISSDKRYLGFVMDGKVNNSDPRGIILVEGGGQIYINNQRHITLYGNSNLITTTTDDPFNLESSTNNIIYRGDGTPTPPAYDHETWLSTFIP